MTTKIKPKPMGKYVCRYCKLRFDKEYQWIEHLKEVHWTNKVEIPSPKQPQNVKEVVE